MKKRYYVLLLTIIFFLASELSGFMLNRNVDSNVDFIDYVDNQIIIPINDTFSFYDVLFFPNNISEYKLFSYLVNENNHDIKCNFYDFDDYFYDNLVNYSNNLSHIINFDVVVFEDNKKHFDLVYNLNNTYFNIKKLNLNLSLLYVTKSRGLMHNKFCIIDQSIVIMGSTNPTLNGLTKNNNNLFIVDSKVLAKNYLDEFNELKTKSKNSYVLNPKINLCNGSICFLVENFFCPEDHCEDNVINNLKKSKSNIVFYTFSFTSKNIADLLVLKSNNISIEGIFEKSQNSQYSVKDYLSEYISVNFDHNKYNMHNKIFVIDNDTVITGSYNPTNNGNVYNDENILIIHNPTIAQTYLNEYYVNIK